MLTKFNQRRWYKSQCYGLVRFGLDEWLIASLLQFHIIQYYVLSFSLRLISYTQCQVSLLSAYITAYNQTLTAAAAAVAHKQQIFCFVCSVRWATPGRERCAAQISNYNTHFRFNKTNALLHGHEGARIFCEKWLKLRCPGHIPSDPSRYRCQRPTIIHKWLTSHAVNHMYVEGIIYSTIHDRMGCVLIYMKHRFRRPFCRVLPSLISMRGNRVCRDSICIGKFCASVFAESIAIFFAFRCFDLGMMMVESICTM